MSVRQHISSCRKKHRTESRLKHVTVFRGQYGYGFTISSQKPCILSCILEGSPADLAGLRAGDALQSVNGWDVTQALHDEVVQIIGQTALQLDLQVAENISSESSDDEVSQSKLWYPAGRPRQFRRKRVDRGKLFQTLPQRPGPVSQGPGQNDSKAELPEMHQEFPAMIHSYNHSFLKSKVGHRRSLNTPVVCQTTQLSVHSSYRKDFEKPGATMSATQTKHFVSSDDSSFSTVLKDPASNHSECKPEVHRRPAVQCNQSASLLSVHDTENARVRAEVATRAEGENDRSMSCQPSKDKARAVVGYIGSMELLASAGQSPDFPQQLKNIVSQLLVDAMVHTPVLMEVDASGVQLTSGAGHSMAFFSAERLAFSGVCPDEERYFGIITFNDRVNDSDSSSCTDPRPSSSCHVFKVDPEKSLHSEHVHQARAFNLQCTPCSNTDQCQEFPVTPSHLILCMSHLYHEHSTGTVDNDLFRSQTFTDPSQASQDSDSSSGRSDSGLGLGHEDDPPKETLILHNQQHSGGSENNDNTDLTTVRKTTSSPTMDTGDGTLCRCRSADLFQVNRPSLVQRPRSVLEMQSYCKTVSSCEKLETGLRCTDDQVGVSQSVTSHPVIGQPAPSATSDHHLFPHSSPTEVSPVPSADDMKQSTCCLPQVQQPPLQQEETSSSDSDSLTSSDAHSSDSAFTPSSIDMPRLPAAPAASWSHQHSQQTSFESISKLDTCTFIKPDHKQRSASVPQIPSCLHLSSHRENNHTSITDNKEKVPDTRSQCSRDIEMDISLSSQLEILGKQARIIGRRERNAAHLLGTANSDNSIVSSLQPGAMEEVGRVAGWAVSFPRLLADPAGLGAFTEFVKLEHSEENIKFWNAVESFRQLSNEHVRWNRAQDIYRRYLDSEASEAVNVDSAALQMTQLWLHTPSPFIFDIAQRQVFELMKTDSYRRFLKSDLYKNQLLREMESQTLLSSMSSTQHAGQDLKEKSTEKENQEKRKFLLPWKQMKISSLKIRKKKPEDKEGADKENAGKADDDSSQRDLAPGLGLMLGKPFASDEGSCSEKFRVVLDADNQACQQTLLDTSMARVNTCHGLKIRSVLGKLCTNRNLSVTSPDVHLGRSCKNKDRMTLETKDVTGQSVFFQLELPNGRSIGVKARSQHSIRDILKPILQKYGYNADTSRAFLPHSAQSLDLDQPVSDLERQQVLVTVDTDSKGRPQRRERSSVFWCAANKRQKKTEIQRMSNFYLVMQ